MAAANFSLFTLYFSLKICNFAAKLMQSNKKYGIFI